MKRYFFILILAIFLVYLLPAGTFALPEFSAKSVVLIDASSGRVLFEKNAHERLPQASTTKITTALVALENADLKKKIPVPDNFVNPGESGIYLEPGEVHLLNDLMYALLLKSANDAAEAIAIGVAGSKQDFVKIMNQRVQDMGLKDTHYINPHGLHNENHYTSAYDLAMIAKEALKNEEFRKIVTTNEYTLPWPGHDYSRIVYNGNRLLKTYEGANGVKNGFTKQAGNCLVGSANRNGMELIAVVMHSNAMYDEVAALLDYGFNNYQLCDFFKDHQTMSKVNVEGGKEKQVSVVTENSLSIALKGKEINQLEQKLYLPVKINAPVKMGQRLGIAIVQINSGTSVNVELVAGEEVQSKSFLANLFYRFVNAFNYFLASII